MAIGRAVVIGRKGAPGCGSDAQHRKIRTRHQLAAHPLGVSLKGHAHVVLEAAEHPAEDGVVLAEIVIHGVGQRVHAPVATVVETLHLQRHQLLRVLYRQQAQQDLIEQREDRRVCADAEGQREDGHNREDG